MQRLTCSALLVLLAASPALRGHDRELFLAGGALRTCSSLAARDCLDADSVTGEAYRQPAQVVFDREGIAAALDPRLWVQQPEIAARLAKVLADARRQHGDATLEMSDASQAIATRCVLAARVRRCDSEDRAAPWSQLDDDMRSAVLAALEQPQLDASGGRRREVASLDGGRSPHGAAILRAFVAAARERAEGRAPRIAVVTASAFDPFDPVDFYLDALRDAGAQPRWWPVDAALAAAVFERRDCSVLPELRVSLLRLPGRARVFPDLVAQQADACVANEALARVPDEIEGVFFAGGDQWKLRRAFFDADDRPNAWLLALRRAAARGDVVIGGTSAGSAVQSGGPMLTNGTTAWALRHGAVASKPPVPGCTRSRDCVAGLDEDVFSYWLGGGIGLAPDMVIDTHFSDRAREVRLLSLLAQTGTRWGVGADETSAVHLRWEHSGAVQARAIGAAGGWMLDAVPGCRDNVLRARAHYLAPGATLRVHPGGVDVVPDTDESAQHSTRSPGAQDALADGALRGAAQSLAGGNDRVSLRAGTDGAIATLARTRDTRTWHSVGAAFAGITSMQLAISAIAGCDIRAATGRQQDLPGANALRKR